MMCFLACFRCNFVATYVEFFFGACFPVKSETRDQINNNQYVSNLEKWLIQSLEILDLIPLPFEDVKIPTNVAENEAKICNIIIIYCYQCLYDFYRKDNLNEHKVEI